MPGQYAPSQQVSLRTVLIWDLNRGGGGEDGTGRDTGADNPGILWLMAAPCFFFLCRLQDPGTQHGWDV